MTPPPRSVLAIAHDGTRTGAPAVLLSLLRWVADEHGIRPRTVLRRGGPLVADFAALGPTRALRPWGRRGVVDAVEAGLGQVGLDRSAARVTPLEARLRGGSRPAAGRLSADLVIVNGVSAAALLPAVDPGAECAVVVHELPTALARAARPEDLALLWERAGRVVAVSERVAEALVADKGVDPGRVTVAHEFIPDRVDRLDRDEARDRVGLDRGALVVAGVGAGSWRKGIDLFVQVAGMVRRALDDAVRFVWVGPVDAESEVRHDIAALGLQDTVVLAGPAADTGPWFDALDVLALTSREDPFPLVVLEAGLAGRPVVSFANGGAPEVITPDGGIVVDYLDVAAMADAVVTLARDPGRRRAMGERLGERVRADHVVATGAPVMWRALTGA